MGSLAGNVLGGCGGGGVLSGCYLQRSTNQSVPDATWTSLAFDIERYDTDGYHSAAVGNEYMTVPFDGIYSMVVNIRWQAGGGNRREVYIYSLTKGHLVLNQFGGTIWRTMQISQQLHLSKNEKLVTQVYHNHGAALNIEFAGYYTPVWSIALIARGSV